MAKKTNGEVKKRKPVKIRRIEREHAGKVVAVYTLMESLIGEHHEHLADCTICLAWQQGWKADVDGILLIAKVVPASALDKLFVDVDFVIKLNEEAWPGLSDERKRIVMDHELMHIAMDVDRDGEQTRDTKDRLCWRLRKHPIQEFPAIIDRYGINAVLKLNLEAKDAADIASRPLFAGLEAGGDGEGDTKVKPDAWKRFRLPRLGLKNVVVGAFEESGIMTLGQLSKLMEKQGQWWHREIKGIGDRMKEKVEAAFIAFWKAHPEFCREEPEAIGVSSE